MKSVANWYVRIGGLVLVLAVAVAALACGGGGGSLNLTPSDSGSGSSASANVKSTGILVTEEEIPTLPAWQQELLSDPGWNQPYIEPREETPIMAPSDEMLDEAWEEFLARGESITPRGIQTGKSASWNDQDDFDPEWSIGQGEFNCPMEETPGYGCNVDWGNEYGSKSHGSDDPIADKDYINEATQRISYVLEGLASPNWFNDQTGGTGNDALSCVYQLFCNDEEAHPVNDADDPSKKFAELSYRSDLGGGRNSGADCDHTAFEVSGKFWRAFNRDVLALPNGETTPAYNILVAPASEESDEYVSSGGCGGKYQEFYLGNVSNCYGGGMIVGIESSIAACDDFNTWVDQDDNGFFYNPIYGVLMRRWQATTPASSAANWWEGPMGWPVFGPKSYNEGASTLTSRGTYYAWGMWFEKGFIWWIDYDQTTRPNTPDEGQAYLYSGSNVYCKDGAYAKINTAYYGGAGDLAATVSVDGYRDSAVDAWDVPLFEDNAYHIAVPSEDGLATVQVALSAHPYGGTPRASDCAYQHCTWAFRDGQIQAAGSAYDQDQFKTVWTYGSSSLPNMENSYVVRVQIVDSLGAKGYGDSFPIFLGHSGAGGDEVLLVRDDGGSYSTNYNAIKADLDTLGIAYSEYTYNGMLPSTASTKIVIWYRGGPAGGEANLTTEWSSGGPLEIADLLDNGTSVLLFSQNHSGNDNASQNTYYTLMGCTLLAETVPTAEQDTFFAAEGLEPGGYANFTGSPLYGLGNAAYDAVSLTLGNQTLQTTPWYSGYTMIRWEPAELNNASGFVPTGLSLPSTAQVGVRGYCWWTDDNDPTYGSLYGFMGVNDDFTAGMQISETSVNFIDYAQISYGTSGAPGYDDISVGTADYYCVGYPWDDMTWSGAGIESYHVLHNILFWFDDTLTLGFVPVGASPYNGDAEIVSVTPISWEAMGGVVAGGIAHESWYDATEPAVQYPDFTGTDVYRDTANGAGENYVVDTVAKVEDGLNPNDVDFQFPYYGFWYDPDGSLLGPTYEITDDEVWVGRGGLVVEDGDPVWTRIEPQQPIADNGAGAFVDPLETYANWYAFANYDIDTGTPEIETLFGGAVVWPFAGFYVTTLDVIGDPGLDTSVKANYGSDMAHIEFNHDVEPLFFECVAHWPDEYDPLNTTSLDWSLFPGHGVGNIRADQYGFDGPWDLFILENDIDPMVTYTAPGSTYVPYLDRDAAYFLRYVFEKRGDSSVNNRLVEFDYSLVESFLGDLDADGTPGEVVDDKFPVRVRLATDYAPLNDRPGVYPDHWPDASETHVGWIEGGCYVSSSGTGAAGAAVPPTILSVTYDPYSAPGVMFWTGTYPSSPQWRMDVNIEVAPYAGPVNFELDFDVDPVEFVDPLVQPASFTPAAGFAYSGVQGLNVWSDVEFTAAEAEQIPWIVGQQTYLGVRAYGANPTGPHYYAYCAVPMWLGDVAWWEDFEVDPGIAGFPRGAFGGVDSNRSTYYYRQGTTLMDLRWDTPTGRSYHTPHANNGTGMAYIDAGGANGGIAPAQFNYLLTPEFAVSDAAPIFICSRAGSLTSSTTSWTSNHTCLMLSQYSGNSWTPGLDLASFDTGETYGNNTQYGNTPSEVMWCNDTALVTAYGAYTPVSSTTNLGRFGQYLRGATTQTPGGVGLDNLLCTHADMSNTSRWPPFL